MNQRIIISKSLEKDLTLAISECEHDKVFVLADETTIELMFGKLLAMVEPLATRA